jgi:hypothetical protein
MIKSLIKHFKNAPDCHIESSTKEEITNLEKLGNPKQMTEGLFDIMNKCVYLGGASDIMIISFESVLKACCNKNKYDYKSMLEDSHKRCDVWKPKK